MAVKDLVSGVLAEPITTSTTNILVTIAQNIGASGIQAFFPTPPFYITIMPKSPIIGVANRLDSEIIQVTAVGHDQVGNAALTGVRAQRDTTAKAFSTGDIVTVGSYCDDAVFLGDEGSHETETPWIETDDIADDAVTADKIDWSSMSENNNNIRKIYTTTVTGTTDQNGFFAVDTSIITPSNAIIIGARGHGNYNGFYFPYTDTVSSRFTIRCSQWDLAAFVNSYRECDIAYIKVN